MSQEHDEDIDGITRQRTSREEVRRRNREIMDRANAEMRGSKNASGIPGTRITGSKETSRLSVIKAARTGSQAFWVPYEFHTSTPGLSVGALNVDLNVDTNRFTEFNRENVSQLYVDCIKSTCLIDESSIAFLDLINPEESYPSSAAIVDPLDEPLLSNEVSISTDSTDSVYTGHFLRKPQLMSNDLFTEGGRKLGSSKFVIPSGMDSFEAAIHESFEHVKQLDHEFSKTGSILNAVTKMKTRPKRVLSVLPDVSCGQLVQFKFDDKTVNSSCFNTILTKHYSLFESEIKNPDFPKCVQRKRKYLQANKGGSTQNDEFYLLTIPSNESQGCFMKPIGSKILLKRDTTHNVVEEKELVLVNDI
jgi:hypothetical protein